MKEVIEALKIEAAHRDEGAVQLEESEEGVYTPDDIEQQRARAALLRELADSLGSGHQVQLTEGMYRALCGLVQDTDVIEPAEVTASDADWDALREIFPASDAETIYTEDPGLKEAF